MIVFSLIASVISNDINDQSAPPKEIFSAPLEPEEEQIKNTTYSCNISQLKLILKKFNNTTDRPDLDAESIRRCISSIDRSAIERTDQCSVEVINNKLDSLIQNIPNEESRVPLIRLRSEIIGGAENFGECFD